MGNSTKVGRGYTKTDLNSSTRLEVARPRKSMPTICPQKGRNSLGRVKSKIGTFNSKVEPQSVAYLFKKFDLTARGWPPDL